MKHLPQMLKKYFWDTDFSKLDKNSHSQFIIERILNYGDEKAVEWLFGYFKKAELKETLEKRRNISPLSANYWGLILNIPKNKILCLRKQSQDKLQKTWSYPLLKKPIGFKNINIASIVDIAAMKMAAISERGTKRDFIDLYFILQKNTLNEVFNSYDRKYQKLSSNLVHIKKSLVYFEDAENDPMPKMLIPVSWKKVKDFFREEIKKS